MVRAFATSSFLVFGLLLLFLALFTSNTANILAWGILGSTDPIADNLGTLLIYEAVHASPAFAVLALGCWVAMLLPLIDVFRAEDPSQAIPRFYATGIRVFLAFLIVAIGCNWWLMRFPGDAWRGWVKAMLERPSGSPWLPYWLIVLPLPIMVAASFPLWRAIGKWTVVASLLALPLLMFPLVLRNYLSHHFLCSSIGGVYVTAWTVVSPLLFAMPIVLVAFVKRDRNS